MACPEFESGILGHDEIGDEERRRVDDHIETCAACAAYLEASLAVEAELTEVFRDIEPSGGFDAAVRRRLQSPPSRLPELLDAAAWLGICALIGILAWRFLPPIPAVTDAEGTTIGLGIAIACGVVLLGCAFLALRRSLAELSE